MKIPLPMTFDTTIAAPSIGPRPLTSEGDGEAFVFAVRDTRGPGGRLLGQELTLDLVLDELHPLSGAVLDVELDLDVDEIPMLEHLPTGAAPPCTRAWIGW